MSWYLIVSFIAIYFLIIFLSLILIIYKAIEIVVHLNKTKSEFIEKIKEFNQKNKSSFWSLFVPFWHLKYLYLSIKLVSFSNEKAINYLMKKMVQFENKKKSDNTGELK